MNTKFIHENKKILKTEENYFVMKKKKSNKTQRPLVFSGLKFFQYNENILKT